MSVELKEIFSAIAKKMQIDFNLQSKGIQHRGLKGRARETVLGKFLREYLPKSFGIGHGEILSFDGKRSDEMDIVIYDAVSCPILYCEDEVQIFPAEAVYAVIQVKSHLNTKELEKSLENITSAKELVKKPLAKVQESAYEFYGSQLPSFPILGYVFSFSSIKLTELLQSINRIYKEQKIDITKQIEAICVLDKGVFLNISPQDNRICKTPEKETILVYTPNPERLLIFYFLLYYSLSQILSSPINLVSYLDALTLDYVFQKES